MDETDHNVGFEFAKCECTLTNSTSFFKRLKSDFLLVFDNAQAQSITALNCRKCKFTIGLFCRLHTLKSKPKRIDENALNANWTVHILAVKHAVVDIRYVLISVNSDGTGLLHRTCMMPIIVRVTVRRAICPDIITRTYLNWGHPFHRVVLQKSCRR